MKNKPQNSAYWIQKTHLFRADEYVCSECKFNAKKPYAKCPNCERDMNKKSYDPTWVDEMEAIDATDCFKSVMA